VPGQGALGTADAFISFLKASEKLNIIFLDILKRVYKKLKINSMELRTTRQATKYAAT
jgi:hypothetical protein